MDAHVSRDLGFGGVANFVVRLRLNRINCSPISTDQGSAAAAYVRRAVIPAIPVDIETFKPYKYSGPDYSPGEWMAEIVLPDGSNLSDDLVVSGLALYWDGQGPRPGG